MHVYGILFSFVHLEIFIIIVSDLNHESMIKYASLSIWPSKWIDVLREGMGMGQDSVCPLDALKRKGITELSVN